MPACSLASPPTHLSELQLIVQQFTPKCGVQNSKYPAASKGWEGALLGGPGSWGLPRCPPGLWSSVIPWLGAGRAAPSQGLSEGSTWSEPVT